MTSLSRRNRRTTVQAAIRCGIRISLIATFAWLGTVTAAAQPPQPVQPARFQPPARPAAQDTLFEQQYQIQLDVPSMERVFRIENEEALFERISQEFRTRNDRAVFPQAVEVGKEVTATMAARNVA